ncbi:hypothetical protein HMPREF9233_00819 [Actinobaculum massiliense ACS-171-V-Col2]|uniref:Uncharacterized protein n=2 Tax=Actinobaculum TaxID=76833 RepID=K9EE16_9ACTO|nr:hypothetical protein HMPREF9233_00819 [Actinobaculum massiliense ACS-171-V-Col2]
MVYPTFMADHPGLSVEEAMKAQMHETLIAEKVFIGDQDALGGGHRKWDDVHHPRRVRHRIGEG